MKLPVTADDFGLNHSANQACLNLARKGQLDRLSVLVNLCWKQSIFNQLPRLQLPIALHFNLTEGRPVSPASAVSSLVDRQGRFYPLAVFLLRLWLRKINPDDIKKELEIQLDLLSAVVKVSAINSHQQIHAFGLVSQTVLHIAKQRQIKLIRSLWTINQRLKKFIIKFIIFRLSLGLLGTKLKKSADRYKEITIHPGTNYD